ncbi:hypothetical protein N7456_006770 [Penicillium angulare]|uniref:Uncharacterized protein n=1 Tax=Penicillium angulare TaxID=116970 RepID=A0A9W9FI85_9EURO|nr:hypothetical protein N7456_006770 [Penicillium angulare]
MGMILKKRENYILVKFTNNQESDRTLTTKYKDPLDKHEPPREDEGQGDSPGYWAAYAAKHIWRQGYKKFARHGKKTPMVLTEALAKSPVVREPVLNPRFLGRVFTGGQYLEFISKRKDRFEAFQIQARGCRRDGDEACGCCRAGHGFYASCVRFEGLGGSYLVCANCHRGAQGARCDFHKSRITANAPTQNNEKIESNIITQDVSSNVIDTLHQEVKNLLEKIDTVLDTMESASSILQHIPSLNNNTESSDTSA